MSNALYFTGLLSVENTWACAPFRYPCGDRLADAADHEVCNGLDPGALRYFLVRTIADDRRIGRLLFNPALSNPVLARKRAGLGGYFAILSGEHVTNPSSSSSGWRPSSTCSLR